MCNPDTGKLNTITYRVFSKILFTFGQMSMFLINFNCRFVITMKPPTMNYKNLVSNKCEWLLNRKAETISCKTGDLVLRQGELPKHCFILMEGKVRVFHTTSSGQSFLFGVFDIPQLYGDLEIPNNDRYFNSVQCITDCKFLKMSNELFLEWLQNDSNFALKVNSDLCSKLMKASYRMIDYNFFPLEYHLLKYIAEESDHFIKSKIPVNKTDLAAYFGSNIRSINRILKQFTSESMIEISKGEIHILNADKINNGIIKYF